MTNKVYSAFFLGQGGELFSWGINPLANLVKGLGAEADVFIYEDYQKAEANILEKRKDGYKIALVGYSLGDTSITYIQTQALYKIDLLIAIAESPFGQNYLINKTNTKRSILFHGPDFLSDAGSNSGFDEVINLPDFHLFMDLDPKVFSVVKDEFSKLITGE
jgi:hypothetical protein